MKETLKSQWCWKGFIFFNCRISYSYFYLQDVYFRRSETQQVLNSKGSHNTALCTHCIFLIYKFRNWCSPVSAMSGDLSFALGRLLVAYLNQFQMLCIMKYPHPFFSSGFGWFFFAPKSQEAICQVTKPFSINLLPGYWTEMIALQALSQEKGRKLLEERRSWHTFPLLK